MIKEVSKIHFLGICGTAMGAVAAALQERGYDVTGVDEGIYPPMSTFLEEKGIKIRAGFSAEALPPDVDLVVIGNAMKRGNPEVEEVLNRKMHYVSLPEVLKEFFMRGKHNLVVTGTHGKTTTTSLLTWIFEYAGKQPGFMIGGIPANLGQGARLNDSPYFIIEGDEYDTAFFDKRSKFIHYLPELVIVNNVEYDHADVYSNLEEIKTSFRRMLNIVPSNGMILLNADDPVAVEVAGHCLAPIVEVGFSENAGNQIRDVEYSVEGSGFVLNGEKYWLPMIGEFNIRNAAMAISAARVYGVEVEVIQKALKEFRSVKRRQELRGEAGGVKVIDDFGHHPTAIKGTLQALRHQYPGARLWAVFEPRSNTTRRAVFQDRLPDALGYADGVVLSQVAKLEQIPVGERLNPEKVVKDLEKEGVEAYYLAGVEEILGKLVQVTRAGDVVVVFSNGGFDGIHGKLLNALETKDKGAI